MDMLDGLRYASLVLARHSHRFPLRELTLAWSVAWTRALLGVLVIALAATTTYAQVTVGTELTRERTTYHFDAPSSYDTSELVPHFFEQHYVLDNVWVELTAAYRAGADWKTSVGATPVRQAPATDFDTFYNPGGIVWVAGTTGDARVHSLRLEQEIELGRARGWRLSAGYRMQMDRADFLEGDRTDTRNGVLVSRQVVTTREYTNAQSHLMFVRASHTLSISPQWQVRLSGDASPAALHRLAIQLPDKYPGQTLVYSTANLGTTGRVDLARTHSNWPIAVHARVGRTWRYSAKQTVSRDLVGLGVSVGRTW